MNFIALYDNIITTKGGYRSCLDYCYNQYSSGNLKTNSFGGIFMPGTVYTFDYIDRGWIESVKKNSKLYYDYKPLVFCLNPKGDNKTMIGLNLNIMPQMARKRFFFLISKIFGKPNGDIDYPKFTKIPITLDNISNIYDLKSDIAINSYDRRYMTNIKAISWEEFPILIFLNTKRMLYARKMNTSFFEKQL